MACSDEREWLLQELAVLLVQVMGGSLGNTGYERYSPDHGADSLTSWRLGWSLRHFRASGRMVRRLRTRAQLMNDPRATVILRLDLA